MNQPACGFRVWGLRAGLVWPLVLLLFSAGTALGQRPGLRRGLGPRPRPNQSRPAEPPVGFFKRLRELPPAEQERVMASDARFRRLPSVRQQMIRQRLERWNALTPEQHARFREREEIFESLSPAQREEARALFPEWRRLPLERRNALMEAFRQVRDMPPGQREQFLNGPEAVQRFSPEERSLLGGLTRLLPDSPSAAPRDPEE
jgi:uncharacterized protein DUF3106